VFLLETLSRLRIICVFFSFNCVWDFRFFNFVRELKWNKLFKNIQMNLVGQHHVYRVCMLLLLFRFIISFSFWEWKKKFVKILLCATGWNLCCKYILFYTKQPSSNNIEKHKSAVNNDRVCMKRHVCKLKSPNTTLKSNKRQINWYERKIE
jgi:hypothetical protein